ncbi:IS630 family transposase, partial [Oceanimonas baumannii]|nr:IS630 family transposase [Oceanimonas baumannii]
MTILPSLPRSERCRMHKIIQTTRDKQHARRVMAILLRYEGYTLKKIHQLTGAARSTLGR